MAKPGFYFYTGDWVKDTSCLSLEAQGAWMRALCILYEHGGEVTWPLFSFAHIWGTSVENALHILTQLELTRVANVEWQNHDKTLAKLSNRRMLREARIQLETKEKRAEAGKKGAAARWQKCDSSSSSSSSLNHSENAPERTPSAVPKVQDSRKLSDEIKRIADPIYRSNPVRFKRLIVWIKEKEKRDYPVETITTTLRLFWEREQKSKVAEWWPYINRIFTKQWTAWNEEQSKKHKAADASFVRELVVRTAGVLKA